MSLYLLTQAQRRDFDRRLENARAMLDDADPNNDDEARDLVEAIKAERRALKATARDARRANGGGFLEQLVEALVDRPRAEALVVREIKDRIGAVVAGELTPDEALEQIGEQFVAEWDHVIRGASIGPVLVRHGVPKVLAAALGIALEAVDGPVARMAWNAIRPWAHEQLERLVRIRSPVAVPQP